MKLNIETSARDELLKIENSNDCCTTQDLTWTKEYSQAAECNREEKYRMIYADQDEKRGCVKVISQTALSFMPVLISEIICGCLCLLLGLWTIYIICHINDRYNNLRSDDKTVQVTPTIVPVTQYPYYPPNKTIQNIVPEVKVNGNQTNKLINNHTITRHSYPSIPFNKIDKSLYTNTVTA